MIASIPPILIVGAGLTDCTTANRLAQEGVRSILLEDIRRQSREDEILMELEQRRNVEGRQARRGRELRGVVHRAHGPDPLRALHPPIHGEAVGRPARELSAKWAPRRVQIRWDDDPYLFKDPYQGWPVGPNGYTDLIDGLFSDEHNELRCGVDVNHDSLDRHARHFGAEQVILTGPLDVLATSASAAWSGAGSSSAACTFHTYSTRRAS